MRIIDRRKPRYSVEGVALLNSPAKDQSENLDVVARTSYASSRPLMRRGYFVRSDKAVAVLVVIDFVLRMLTGRRPVSLAVENPKRILIANWAHIGDVLLSLPAIEAVRRRFPDAEIDLIISRGSRVVVEDTGLYTNLLLIDHFMLNRSGSSLVSKLKSYALDRHRAICAARQRKYDVAIDLYSHFPPASPLFWSAGIPVRCGFTSGGFGPLLTHPTAWLAQSKPMADYGRDLLDSFCRSHLSQTLRPVYPGHPRYSPHSLIPEIANGYVVVHPGSGSKSREWTDEKWCNLVEKMVDGRFPLVLCGTGPRETERISRLSDAVQGRLIPFTNRRWDEFVSIVAQAQAVVCLDSSASHLAAAFGVPTVAILTGTNQHRLWGPDNDDAIIVTARTACAPCHRVGCEAMACIQSVTPSMVLTAFDKLLPLHAGNRQVEVRKARPELSAQVVDLSERSLPDDVAGLNGLENHT